MSLISLSLGFLLLLGQPPIVHAISQTTLGLLETLLFEDNLFNVVDGCGVRVLGPNPNDTSNTPVAAQWVRVAYHDMATHDVDNGTGGLDGSIAFELDRDQNVGIGMIDSLTDFQDFVTPDISCKSIIFMMSSFLSSYSVRCDRAGSSPFSHSMRRTYRGGRIDTQVPGPATVPLPQEDLATHTEMFRKQGFNATEMIQLVACGHTLGGVRNPDFPTIVTTANTLTRFDGTDAFDTVIVTGYLNGTTQNPLVVTEDVTMRSDLRIFSSDGNKTVQSMSSPEVFSSTCQDLMARMIDTVLNDVVLSSPIQPVDQKIYQIFMSVNADDTVNVHVQFRLLHLLDNPNRVVTMSWKDPQAPVCNNCSVVAFLEERGVPSTGSVPEETIPFQTPMFTAVGANPSKFHFVGIVNASTSISNLQFSFEVDEKDGSSPTTFNKGSIIDQDVLFLDQDRTRQSEIVFDDEGRIQETVVVAVRKDAGSVSNISLETFAFGPKTSFVPVTTTVGLQPNSSIPETAHYTFYSFVFPEQRTLPDDEPTVNGFTLVGNVGGSTYRSEYISFGDALSTE